MFVWTVVLAAVAGEGAGAPMPMWSLLLTSAAVGALVAAGLQLLGQYLERRARRREMCLGKAVELALADYEDARDLCEQLNRLPPGGGELDELDYSQTVRHALYAVHDFYRWLHHLYSEEDLPNDAVERLKGWGDKRQRINEAIKKRAASHAEGTKP